MGRPCAKLADMDEAMPEGVYESLRTVGLDRGLAAATGLTPHFSAVDVIDEPEMLARHIAGVVRRTLASRSGIPGGGRSS